ncbi:MAG TPA: hypothetical protein VGC07_10500 [Granulicella sp.]
MRLSGIVAIALLGLSGCHSAFVDATVSNRTASTILLLEVDYPSASFGTENLAPGKDYHYRFKVIGSGPLKLVYTDSSHKEIEGSGPSLNEDDEGPLSVVIAPDGIHWSAPPAKH